MARQPPQPASTGLCTNAAPGLLVHLWSLHETSKHFAWTLRPTAPPYYQARRKLSKNDVEILHILQAGSRMKITPVWTTIYFNRPALDEAIKRKKLRPEQVARERA